MISLEGHNHAALGNPITNAYEKFYKGRYFNTKHPEI